VPQEQPQRIGVVDGVVVDEGVEVGAVNESLGVSRYESAMFRVVVSVAEILPRIARMSKN